MKGCVSAKDSNLGRLSLKDHCVGLHLEKILKADGCRHFVSAITLISMPEAKATPLNRDPAGPPQSPTKASATMPLVQGIAPGNVSPLATIPHGKSCPANELLSVSSISQPDCQALEVSYQCSQ